MYNHGLFSRFNGIKIKQDLIGLFCRLNNGQKANSKRITAKKTKKDIAFEFALQIRKGETLWGIFAQYYIFLKN